MTEKGELRNMVMSFRVSELQLLLGLANQSRCGRKTELMQRALQLVDRGVSVQVQQKIRELYQKYTQRLSVGYTSYLMNHKQLVTATGTANNNVISTNASEPVNGSPSFNSNVPTHPEVRLKQLPFYDIITDIMKPVGLVPRLNTRQQECRLSFCLTDHHVKEISNSRETLGGQTEFTVQLQLRFCLIDSSCRQPDCFPNGITVKVNGVAAPLPNPIPTNKPGAEPKRPNRPVDITRLCRLSSAITNVLSVSWNVEENKSHCLCINLVRKLTSQILLQRLKRNGFCKPESTKALIKEKLSLDRDIEIATTSLRVSLLCPLGKMRMSLPCRATSCSHLQCFDALTFLQMNEKKPTWMCPVCDRPADFNKLVIDGLFVEVLKEITDSMEVELMKDGSWNVTKTEEFEENNRAPTPTSIAVDVHNVTDEDVIDLTETDEESDNRTVRVSSLNRVSGRSNPNDLSLTEASNNNGSRPLTPQLVSNSSNSPTVYDLSPVHIPLINTPPTPISHSPILQPPAAHQQNRATHQSFKSSSNFSSSSSASMSPFNLPPHYPSSSTPIYPPLGLESMLPSDPAMLEFLSLMAPIGDFPAARGGFDYMYQNGSSVRSSASDGVLSYDKDTGSTSPGSGRS